MKRPVTTLMLISVLFIATLWVSSRATPQQQTSGGGNTAIVQGGNTAIVTAGGALKTDGSAVTQPVSGTFWQATQPVSGTFWQATQPVSGTVTITPSGTQTITGAITNTAFGVSGGVANIGIVRSVPSPCTQSTNFTNSTVGVATGAGTSVTSTTTCITEVYVNNITNSAVTFRLQDKTGTPVIWVGGNADFTVPANSNVRFPLDGVTFTSGITAIAGTTSALNLQIAGLQ